MSSASSWDGTKSGKKLPIFAKNISLLRPLMRLRFSLQRYKNRAVQFLVSTLEWFPSWQPLLIRVDTPCRLTWSYGRQWCRITENFEREKYFSPNFRAVSHVALMFNTNEISLFNSSSFSQQKQNAPKQCNMTPLAANADPTVLIVITAKRKAFSVVVVILVSPERGLSFRHPH